ncbi:MAG: XdhC family protein [Ignavibacteriales bacterium]|nr:XdhC family protein [Ignavibacteriales bacterium]
MDIYKELLDSLETEEQIILATIVSTKGSTPSAALSKMIIKNQGKTSIGTIGGGCVEADVLGRAQQKLQTGTVETLCFELREDEYIQGLICGGTINVLLEPIGRDLIPFFRDLKSIRDNGNDSVIGTFLNSDGCVKCKTILAEMRSTELCLNKEQESYWQMLLQKAASPLQNTFVEIIASSLKHQGVTRIPLNEGELIFEPVPGLPNLILFGGGHVSKAICKSAASCGFQVTVTDDREAFCNPARFPEASKTVVSDFSEVFNRITIKPTTYLVIVTRGHQYDEEVLEKALKTPAHYIGMMGSQRKVLTSYKRLLQYGFNSEDLKRVQSPIGIEVGAVTPEEIAISVVAQLIRVRRGYSKSAIDKSEAMYSFFHKNDVPS